MKIAIVGATGAVGKELLSVLERRDFPVSELRLYASARSAGRSMVFRGEEVAVEALPEAPLPVDVVLASAGSSISKQYAPIWATQSVVIDNSSAFRYEPDVPLIVPEINPHAIRGHKNIIANPNCTTAILLMALHPLHKAFKARRVIVSTYQSASGAGASGMEELLQGTKEFLAGRAVEHKTFAHPLPFNVIPQIDAFQENGYTKEEMKVLWETQKIMEDSQIRVSCTAVRVPTLRVHSEAVTVEFEKPVSPEAARAVLSAAPGVDLVDDPAAKRYPMPLSATGKFNVEVGRIRKSLAFDNGLDFFVAGDQLLKGAALNAVQIAELLQKPVAI
ncbi:aspartate-semialdehyde dehydrogenase [Meiothermus ruber]|jgi:aspartate-semialdehyde dehydrogenase|uniref:Aspartate-semialdehyde dehydrogenase n=1 Tax=Meiothermus ruber (strain ATCC 35948 / DSM 1279 / VKM B-1258 / 21) TaxID=504728 RepID=D3PSG9_MEIRD|nr:aspartate-semialdehyde dehydrogenase [Meiothermus ruber]ADD28402.1 aspartate-semialdehyde dehydrogenase [Meiothermus ruber DSM 1279]AGK06157.1 aspartate-semialdehyde dehydrogenase [Meiothermus ruber DSM 1279]MCL6528993.1 aspartate-semialdehyde dehydrogenase [Meiothermus ruber]GAO75359.1 aspartate-semialdehyde dehydrogenase [Meiothermus ruber H328]